MNPAPVTRRSARELGRSYAQNSMFLLTRSFSVFMPSLSKRCGCSRLNCSGHHRSGFLLESPPFHVGYWDHCQGKGCGIGNLVLWLYWHPSVVPTVLEDRTLTRGVGVAKRTLAWLWLASEVVSPLWKSLQAMSLQPPPPPPPSLVCVSTSTF